MSALQGRSVVVVGRGGGIARAITLLAPSEGAHVSDTNPARRIGTVDDVADAVI